MAYYFNSSIAFLEATVCLKNSGSFGLNDGKGKQQLNTVF